jgi:hypothetical protein
MAWRPTVVTVAGLVLLAGPVARAQNPPPPVLAPMTREGAIEQILVNAHGDPDGLLLRDHTLVRFRPDAFDGNARLRVGEEVRVDGEPATTPSGLSLFEARVWADGRLVVGGATAGPPRPPAPPKPDPDADLHPMSVRGRVRLLLTNPDGVIDGLLLEDGTVVQSGPQAHLSRLGIVSGIMVTATGLGGSYVQGRSLHALTLQVGDGAVYSIGRRLPPPRP